MAKKERDIKTFGLVLVDLGEVLRKQSFDLDWILSGIQGIPMTGYFNKPLV